MENHILEKKKSLSLFISKIAKLYFIAKEKCGSGEIHDVTDNNDYFVFITRVERAFDQLTDIEKEFINNDFFYEAYPNWWKKYYSRSNYYRIRKMSMLSFKEAFDHGA